MCGNFCSFYLQFLITYRFRSQYVKCEAIYFEPWEEGGGGGRWSWWGGVKYWLSLKIFCKYWTLSIKSLRISISSVIFVLFKFEYCSKNIHQILHEKIDISNIASKTANIACWLPSGSPYKLLLVEMDNSIVNVFDSAMLCVAPNCRTRNTWLWSQVISHTFCRTKYTVMHSIRCILRTFANIWEGAFVNSL